MKMKKRTAISNHRIFTPVTEAHRKDARENGKKRSCHNCEHYRPEWQFRTCWFIECPYMKGKYTMRKYPFPPDPCGINSKMVPTLENGGAT